MCECIRACMGFVLFVSCVCVLSFLNCRINKPPVFDFHPFSLNLLQVKNQYFLLSPPINFINLSGISLRLACIEQIGRLIYYCEYF